MTDMLAQVQTFLPCIFEVLSLSLSWGTDSSDRGFLRVFLCPSGKCHNGA